MVKSGKPEEMLASIERKSNSVKLKH